MLVTEDIVCSRSWTGFKKWKRSVSIPIADHVLKIGHFTASKSIFILKIFDTPQILDIMQLDSAGKRPNQIAQKVRVQGRTYNVCLHLLFQKKETTYKPISMIGRIKKEEPLPFDIFENI